MKIKAEIIKHPQGSVPWHQHRATHLNASELAAAMGISPYMKRADFIRQRATGVTPEVDDATARRFQQGHEYEAIARPWADEIAGDLFYPTVLAADVEGLPLSVSLDGLTLDNAMTFEAKSGNSALLASLDAGVIPEHYHPQLEQGLMLSGAERCLFMASSGDREAMRYAWYVSRPELRAQIIPTWRQFLADVAAYKPTEAAEPAPVGKAPETLPALRIEVTGAVTASNLAEFKATALAAIRSVNRSLKTDVDFANADKAVKWCAEVEAKLKAAKEHALSQTADIDALFKTLDDISKEAREVRLDLSKVVDRRKLEVKEEAIGAARKALDAHIADLQGELAPMRLQPVAVDFAGAIKGLRSIASMQDALDTALAGGKIAADAQARVIRGNVATFKAKAEGLEFLFADLGQIVGKAADDFALLVDARITKHKADEAAREAKAQAAAQAEAAAPALQPVAQPVQAQPVAVAANAPTAADEPATLNLGAINSMLDADGGLVLRGEFVTNVLQVPAAGRSPRGIALWQASQFPLIVAALNSHLRFVMAQRKAA